jgi:hypothetical protein
MGRTLGLWMPASRSAAATIAMRMGRPIPTKRRLNLGVIPSETFCDGEVLASVTEERLKVIITNLEPFFTAGRVNSQHRVQCSLSEHWSGAGECGRCLCFRFDNYRLRLSITHVKRNFAPRTIFSTAVTYPDETNPLDGGAMAVFPRHCADPEIDIGVGVCYRKM